MGTGNATTEIEGEKNKMKIAISSEGTTLDSKMDPRFGRCAYFLLVDEDTGEILPVVNPAANAMGGAGPQAAQNLSDKGVAVVITGNLGPNAARSLDALGIKAYRFDAGTVKDALEAYKQGKITAFAGATVKGHHGM